MSSAPPCRHLVSSYRGKFGYVRYYVRSVLERPAQPSLQCEREFEVEEPLDVNRADLLVQTHTQVPSLEIPPPPRTGTCCRNT